MEMLKYGGIGGVMIIALGSLLYVQSPIDEAEDSSRIVGPFGTQKDTCDAFRSDYIQAESNLKALPSESPNPQELNTIRQRRLLGDKANLRDYHCHR